MNGPKGTPLFMAPEVLAESHYGRKGDVWAVGCTVIQMFTGKPPFSDLHLNKINFALVLHEKYKTLDGAPLELPKGEGGELDSHLLALKTFLDRIFKRNPDDRPMAKILRGLMMILFKSIFISCVYVCVYVCVHDVCVRVCACVFIITAKFNVLVHISTILCIR